ncbi:diadenosine tetraphosphatase [Geomicrobium sp. JCM 19037]|uniref:metallophosphoesterase n=1 Tax=Geomicrobium sp. JCM 19037 TaxID=1460634 RepID=UPI00045F3354|nr:metallophosphoesterase [Geomicrobium sp. JCM 19037]GAK04535.1 diadenosine tetraphosphatase [Geomicrobium sp. JCM 19037]
MEEKLDFIGDVHGCFDELQLLLQQMGYQEGSHPNGRKLVFIGDLTDRGPNSLDVIRLVYKLVNVTQSAYYIPGNHCDKLYRYWKGNRVMIRHGLETTVAEYEQLPKTEQTKIRRQFMQLYEQSPLYQVWNDGQIAAAHAGIRRQDIGKSAHRLRSFLLYGDVDHHQQQPGKPPVRRDWAKRETNINPIIIYGHTPVPKPRVKNRTINIDTGCVFGGFLTAFHYPERTFTTQKSNEPLQVDAFNHEFDYETLDMD